VPACYLHTPPRLQPGYFSRFQPDTLFYIFYGMPGDEAQLYAADELAARGWYYHKEFKAWLTRAPNTEPVQKTDRRAGWGQGRRACGCCSLRGRAAASCGRAGALQLAALPALRLCM
jgi:hypothetical protein